MIDLRDPFHAPVAVRTALGLQPHPEGGSFREVYRDAPASGRGAVTSILFLLAAGERSHWHKVDAAEIWLWQAGAPLLLDVAGVGRLRLGPGSGEQLQVTVPSHAWQSAQSLGSWTLVSCVVAPAFEFAGFELALPGWEPPEA